MELSNLIETKADKAIFEFDKSLIDKYAEKFLIEDMAKGFGKDIRVNNFNQAQKDVIKDSLKIRLFDDSFGAIIILYNMRYYYQIIFGKGGKNDYNVNSQFRYIMGYLLKIIGKGEFVEFVWKCQEELGLSDKFYNGIVDYNASNRDIFVNTIIREAKL